jgi:hypothetical protein
MRERAEGAAAHSPGPWISGAEEAGSLHRVVTADVHEWCIARSLPSAAAHIAGMHPGVALAVADWLDTEAGEYEELDAPTQAFLAGDSGGDPDGAIVVARAYLNSSTEEK